MSKKQNPQSIERWFDGESDTPLPNDALTPEARAHLRYLETVREGIESVRSRPEIRDEQFDVFMEGIRGRIGEGHPARGGYRSFWALASVVAASLLVALSIMVIFTGGPSEVSARTEIGVVSTELDATVDVETSEDGSTVWIEVTPKDLW